ncbi:MAG: histidine phosphatase family protein, partial [Gemmataceae bacterium]
MPTRVYLLRHAESAAPHVFNGQESDVDLSAFGHRQAQAVAPVLARYAPHAIVSSGMKRAIQTAAPLAELCAINLHIEPLLHERRVGALSGQPFQKDRGLWPETLEKWVQGNTEYTPDGAESFDEIRDRILPVWERLVLQNQDKTFVIVALGMVCIVLLLTIS